MKKITFFNARYFIILLAFGFLPLSGNSQNHFTPATSNGAGNWHFYPVTATLLGGDLVVGDEIAIFDGNVCVGSHTLNDTLDGSYGLAVGNDFMSYEKNGTDPGYTAENSYTWKCWDESEGIEYAGTITFNLTYGPQDYVGVIFPETMEYRWSWIDLNFTTPAAATGDVSGTIKNATYLDSISGVTVTADGTTVYTTTTNDDGYYIFDGIDEDTYSISTSHELYNNGGPVDVTIVSATPKTQDFSIDFKTGKLEGYVKDQNDDGIVGATVTIDGKTGTSVADGYYIVIGVDSGYYDAQATVAAGYAPKTYEDVLIKPNDTTNQNFTLIASGTLEGIVSAGGTDRNDVTVTVVETGDTYNSGDGGTLGDFSFQLPAGTYSLTFEHSIPVYHNGYSSGLVVTAPGTTNADKVLYADNWTFPDGDPFSDMWTIYVNTLKVGGSVENAADEISIWTSDDAGTISSFEPVLNGGVVLSPVASGTATSITGNGTNAVFTADPTGMVVTDNITVYNSSDGGYDGVNLAITAVTVATNFTIATLVTSTETADWFLEDVVNVNSVGHGLTGGENIDIIDTDYDGSYTVTVVDDDNFTIPTTWVVGNDATGSWTNNENTTVTSDAHGLIDGQSVTIANSTTDGGIYNGIHIISSVTTNTFEITTDYNGTDANGDWTYTGIMVGKTNLEGPIENEGYNIALKAYSVLNDGSPGYVDGKDYDLKLYYGGVELNSTSTLDWTATGNGLIDPGTEFPADTKFSQISLVDFDLSPGDLVVDFKDEVDVDPDVDLELTLKQGSTTIDTDTWDATTGDAITFADLAPGDYTLIVSGDRFETTTYTGLSVTSDGTTTENLVIDHFADETQTISLDAGYQLISRRVGDDIYDMSDFLSTLVTLDLNNLDMTKDEDSDFDSYTGGTLDTPNDDIDWNIKRAYNFKMNLADEMEITGTPLAYNADISVRANAYSMISYLPDYALDAEIAFSDLMTSDLEYIRDRHGNSLTKVGGTWVDHIGTCSAGDGFLIKWAGVLTTFNYPAATKSVVNYNEKQELVHFPFYDGYGNPMSNVFTMYVQGSDLEVGDEVAAFDGTTLVGATVITSDNPLDNNLKAFGELFDKDGFISGNQIILKVWKSNEDKEYWLNITNISEDNNLYKGTVYPGTDGMRSIFDVALSPEGINDNLAEYINIYPNPSNGLVNISSPEKIDRLMVINIVGQTVLDINPDAGSTQINLENLNPGVYFVNILIDGQKVTKKLTIK